MFEKEAGGGRRVFSISCEVERAFSAMVEAVAARTRGCCLVDDDDDDDDDENGEDDDDDGDVEDILLVVVR